MLFQQEARHGSKRRLDVDLLSGQWYELGWLCMLGMELLMM